ncbi:MAG TPA: deoxyguanosinetriphosphate triphosphohydrolase [Candidatus Hydrogenedentes bacterium]|nr:deoxyguanosinetriphosphate triphosphohydrolase [Candidatus Hydrogenedentota bacterium]
MPRSHAIRERIEEKEKLFLSPYATRATNSRGRLTDEPQDPCRTVFQRDRDRILHSKAFRRLKRKTQVFLAPAGDHYRTRLTHTLEVSQIARSIARALFLNEDLVEAIALGHDLGHTPFGHAGERVLDRLVPGGFRHYEQSLRVVDLLEARSAGPGLNLSWETRDGILYHSAAKTLLYGNRPAEGPNTLEGIVVGIADAIGYITHDIDDALRAGVITLDSLPQDALNVLGKTHSERIETMVMAVIEGSSGAEIAILPEIREAMVTLRDHMYAKVYPCETIDREIRRAERMLAQLFEYLLEHPTVEMQREMERTGDPLIRVTADFVAGMTDEYAMQLYQELLLPHPWKG